MYYTCQEYNLSLKLILITWGINFFFLKAILCETEAWRMVIFVSSTREQEMSVKPSYGSHIP